MEKKHPENLVEGIAKQAGVSVEETARVLKSLGLDGLTANVGSAGLDISKVGLGDVKLAVRLGRGGVMV